MRMAVAFKITLIYVHFTMWTSKTAPETRSCELIYGMFSTLSIHFGRGFQRKSLSFRNDVRAGGRMGGVGLRASDVVNLLVKPLYFLHHSRYFFHI